MPASRSELLHSPVSRFNPPQCSCLENPGDRGAWWAAVYGVYTCKQSVSGLAKRTGPLHFEKRQKFPISHMSGL